MLEDACKEWSFQSMQDQCNFLSLIPNYHMWDFDADKGVKFDEHFMSTSCKSPRNKMMLMEFDKDVKKKQEGRLVLFKMLRDNVYERKRNTGVKRSRIFNGRESTKVKRKVTSGDIANTLGIPIEGIFDMTLNQTKLVSSIYTCFKTNMVDRGFVAWRCCSSDKNVVSFSDYDPETGLIKVSLNCRYLSRESLLWNLISLLCEHLFGTLYFS